MDPVPNAGTTAVWPDIPFGAWRETRAELHHYTQIVGKYRLARTPWVNHSWHATLYVNARGLTSSLVPDGPGASRWSWTRSITSSSAPPQMGGSRDCNGSNVGGRFPRTLLDLIRALGGTPELHGRPNEIAD